MMVKKPLAPPLLRKQLKKLRTKSYACSQMTHQQVANLNKFTYWAIHFRSSPHNLCVVNVYNILKIMDDIPSHQSVCCKLILNISSEPGRYLLGNCTLAIVSLSSSAWFGWHLINPCPVSRYFLLPGDHYSNLSKYNHLCVEILCNRILQNIYNI